VIQTLSSRVALHRAALLSFLRDLVAIPSYDSDIRAVAARRIATRLPISSEPL
jgi:hypothetical protein